MLGSNLGDRAGYLSKGLQSIRNSAGIELLEISSVYESDPVDYLDQPKFLNLAAKIRTMIGPLLLLRVLKSIETQVGRVPRETSHEREFDVDIIFYGNMEVDSESLVIPHPRAHQRRFVLEPLSEIAAEFVHPVFVKTVGELLTECPDESHVDKITDLHLPLENSDGL